MAFFSKKTEPSLKYLSPSAISPNPNQPRRTFPPQELEELAASIARVGLLQPITVRQADGGWELVAGERRLRAAVMAGLEQVPCLVTAADGERSALLALVENIQRQDLDFWEEALALDRLITQGGLSQAECARRLGKSQPAIANKLRLLKLPGDVLEELRRGGCSERHARALLRLDTPEAQRAAAGHIVAHSLNVAQAEAYVDRLLSPKPRKFRPAYVLKDVRLFLNTVNRGLSVMHAAGVDARCGREETDSEILLTIRIPKNPRDAASAARAGGGSK